MNLNQPFYDHKRDFKSSLFNTEQKKSFGKFPVCAVLVPAFAFYEKGDVVELTQSNFDRLVLQSDEIWVVEVRISVNLSQIKWNKLKFL